MASGHFGSPGDDDLRSLNTRQIIQRITGSRVFQESEHTSTAASPQNVQSG